MLTIAHVRSTTVAWTSVRSLSKRCGARLKLTPVLMKLVRQNVPRIIQKGRVLSASLSV